MTTRTLQQASEIRKLDAQVVILQKIQRRQPMFRLPFSHRIKLHSSSSRLSLRINSRSHSLKSSSRTTISSSLCSNPRSTSNSYPLICSRLSNTCSSHSQLCSSPTRACSTRLLSRPKCLFTSSSNRPLRPLSRRKIMFIPT